MPNMPLPKKYLRKSVYFKNEIISVNTSKTKADFYCYCFQVLLFEFINTFIRRLCKLEKNFKNVKNVTRLKTFYI